MNQIKTDKCLLWKANKELKDKLLQFTAESGRFPTIIDGLMVTRFNHPIELDCGCYPPSIGVIVQGNKCSVLGSKTVKYGEHQCLVNGIDIPSMSNIESATAKEPFLAVSLTINRTLATEICSTMTSTVPALQSEGSGISIATTSLNVLDAFSRLIDVLNTPEHIPVMAPLIIHEIHYLILSGAQGHVLSMISTSGTLNHQIAQSITWLRENYIHPIHIDDLAIKANMASSSFYRYFKQITSLSPIQFQKRLRLYEAQRQMLTEGKDANSASFSVGYESPNQFNREYKRLFGEPPLRNINRLRTEQMS